MGGEPDITAGTTSSTPDNEKVNAGNALHV